jgi:hypothetical protein
MCPPIIWGHAGYNDDVTNPGQWMAHRHIVVDGNVTAIRLSSG